MKPWSWLAGCGSSRRDRLRNEGVHLSTTVQDRHTYLSVPASHSSFVVKVLKKVSTNSMTKMFSPTIMQVAFSSVNLDSKEKPSLEKKAAER
jgi:hypothetical protein